MSEEKKTYSPKFEKFDVHATPYKVVNGQEILVYTLVPRGIESGKHPLIVHWHGGFLISGSAIFPDWFTNWSLNYALLHKAIILSPEHRLLPESTGLDILSDLSDFYTWLGKAFPGYLYSVSPSLNLTPDLSRVLCYGESAGGLLVVQSILHLSKDKEAGNEPRVNITAAIAAYAKVDLDNPEYCTPSTTRSPLGAPQLDPQILNQHLKNMIPGRIVTAAFPPERMQLAIIASQQGRLAELMGTEERLFPLRILQKSEGSGMGKGIFLFAFAGREDSAVPFVETEKLVEAWGRVFGVRKVWGTIESGDHGFDGSADLETPWLREGLRRVTGEWLGLGVDGEKRELS